MQKVNKENIEIKKKIRKIDRANDGISKMELVYIWVDLFKATSKQESQRGGLRYTYIKEDGTEISIEVWRQLTELEQSILILLQYLGKDNQLSYDLKSALKSGLSENKNDKKEETSVLSTCYTDLTLKGGYKNKNTQIIQISKYSLCKYLKYKNIGGEQYKVLLESLIKLKNVSITIKKDNMIYGGFHLLSFVEDSKNNILYIMLNPSATKLILGEENQSYIPIKMERFTLKKSLDRLLYTWLYAWLITYPKKEKFISWERLIEQIFIVEKQGDKKKNKNNESNKKYKINIKTAVNRKRIERMICSLRRIKQLQGWCWKMYTYEEGINFIAEKNIKKVLKNSKNNKSIKALL